LKSTKRTKSQKERKKEINQEKNLQINPSIATTVTANYSHGKPIFSTLRGDRSVDWI
jgi:hypothetical protein